MIRRTATGLLLALSLHAQAQQPPKLEPLPPPPPAPPGVQDETLGDRAVRITPGSNDQIEESIVEGKRVVRVTTPDGRVYFLREDIGETGLRRDTFDSGLRIPLWVIQDF